MKKLKLTILLISICFFNFKLKASQTPTIKKLKQCLVLIKGQDIFNLAGEMKGNFSSIGLVLDNKSGLILIGRDNWPIGPTHLLGQFNTTDEQILDRVYYDPIHNFGFLRFDPKKLSQKLRCNIRLLWRKNALKLGQSLYYLGKDKRGDLLVGEGKINDLIYSPGRGVPVSRFQDYNNFFIRTSTMFKGYERGGVHYDRYGRVVSFRVLHYYYDRGTRYVRVDLPISKIYPAYKELKAGRIPQRGGLGLDLRLLKVRQAKRLGLPEELVSQLIRRFGDETRIWRVDSTVSITEAQEKFKPGDLILKVKGKWLQKGFQNLEETLNKNIGKELEIEFLRSKKVEKATLKVLDLNKQKLKSFIAFAGGVFHPIHWEARKANPLKNLKGVYLSFQSYGSPIQMYGLSPGVLVKKINDQAIKGFDHFIELLKEFKERQQVRVTLLELTKQRQLTVPLKVDTRFFPLRSFHLTRDPDSFALHWQEKDN